MMKLSITIGVFILLPLIALGNDVLDNYDAKFMTSYNKMEMADIYEFTWDVSSDICENATLTLNLFSSIRLNSNFINASNIKCVTVRTGSLSMDSGAFNNLINLEYLDLRSNDIQTKDLFDFGPLPKVKVLLLQDQYPHYNFYSTKVNYVYPELEYLNLRNTGFREFSTYEKPFPKLKYLNLAKNGNERFSLNIVPDTLTHLDLSYNSISYYKPSFGNLSFLQLDNNYIREIGVNGLDLSITKQLEILSIANNPIRYIEPGALSSLANLRYLNLSNNHLSSDSLSEFKYLGSLEVLILDHNSYKNAPKISATNITTLSLKCNNFTSLTVDSFADVPHLRRLSLSNNQISILDSDVFRNQRLLEVLHLDNNKIDYLPANWSQPLENLRYLNLSGNKFMSLESVLRLSLPSSLEILQFRIENVKYITKSMLQMIPDNLTVYIHSDTDTNSCNSLSTMISAI